MAHAARGNQRRAGACSWEDPLGDLFALFPALPAAHKTNTSRPAPVPLRSTVPTPHAETNSANANRYAAEVLRATRELQIRQTS